MAIVMELYICVLDKFILLNLQKMVPVIGVNATLVTKDTKFSVVPEISFDTITRFSKAVFLTVHLPNSIQKNIF